MTTQRILEAAVKLAPEHDGQLVADEFMGRACIRCWGCERIVWRAPD